MEIPSKEMRFGYLISHTFPGIVINIELIIGLDFLTPQTIIQNILEILKNYPGLALVISVGFLILATVSGIVIDGIQHFAFEWAGKTDNDFEGYKAIKNSQHLEIYKYLIDDAYYYYYAAYINTAISIFPGILIVPISLLKMGTHIEAAITVGVVLFAIVCILIKESFVTYNTAVEMEKEFAKSIKGRKRK